MLKKIIKNINNGVILVLIGIMHTSFAFSRDGFGSVFDKFEKSNYFKIMHGMGKVPNFEYHAAFWFFYFGMIVIALGILLFSVEREMKKIPHSFTIVYMIVVLIGCYMIPNSGMTYFMLPHVLFMFFYNFYKGRTKTKGKNY